MEIFNFIRYYLIVSLFIYHFIDTWKCILLLRNRIECNKPIQEIDVKKFYFTCLLHKLLSVQQII